MHVTVFGATDPTGRPLVRQALDRGHEVVAVVHSEENVRIDDPNLSVVEADPYIGVGLGDAVADADAVVSVFRHSRDDPNDLLTAAGENVVAAMQDAGVQRYVTMVSAGVRQADESVSLSGKLLSALWKLISRTELRDAQTHVDHVRETDLDWTVVRVPRLTTRSGTGDYRAGDVDLGFERIAHEDVALFVLDCLDDERYLRELPQVGPA